MNSNSPSLDPSSVDQYRRLVSYGEIEFLFFLFCELFMFSAKSASSTRAALAGLTVLIPPAPKVDDVIASIANKEPNIKLSSLFLTPADMQRLIAAFASLPDKSPITLWVSQTFTNPVAEDPDNLNNFWNVVKHKVTKIIWDQNRFYTSFLRRVAQECQQDSNVARCEFNLCDQTDSVSSPLSVGSSPKSAPVSAYQSALPLFSAAAAVTEEVDPLEESTFSVMGHGQS